MKRVTASKARKHWFRLLDEAAAGEVITIERNEKRLVLRLEEGHERIPSYARLIQAPHPEEADAWSWEWDGSAELTPAVRP